MDKPEIVYLTCSCNRQHKVMVNRLPVTCPKCGFVMSAHTDGHWIVPVVTKVEPKKIKTQL